MNYLVFRQKSFIYKYLSPLKQIFGFFVFLEQFLLIKRCGVRYVCTPEEEEPYETVEVVPCRARGGLSTSRSLCPDTNYG